METFYLSWLYKCYIRIQFNVLSKSKYPHNLKRLSALVFSNHVLRWLELFP